MIDASFKFVENGMFSKSGVYINSLKMYGLNLKTARDIYEETMINVQRHELLTVFCVVQVDLGGSLSLSGSTVYRYKLGVFGSYQKPRNKEQVKQML